MCYVKRRLRLPSPFVVAAAIVASASAAFGQAAPGRATPGQSATAGPAKACYDTTVQSSALSPEEQRTVVVNEAALLQDQSVADFSLSRTLDAIINTTPRAPDGTQPVTASNGERIALLQSMIRSFGARTQTNRESGLSLPVRARDNEAKLDPEHMLGEPAPEIAPGVPPLQDRLRDRFLPVAVFNRFELAADDWSHCGEHRIVYFKGDTTNPAINRMTLIFEARIDNPDPGDRPEGCRPIAEFWDSLRGKTGPDLARALEGFFYRGETGDGRPNLPKPVVHADHYGAPFGQVRGDLFVTGGDVANNAWQLREWRIGLTADGAPVFVPDTVKETPLFALYGNPQQNDPPGIAALRRAFGREFWEDSVVRLTELELAALAPQGQAIRANQLLARLGSRFDERFNDFRSHSQVTPPFPTEAPADNAAGTELPGRITERLGGLRLDSACGLTSDHILNRAGAMTCGGCHDFSRGKAVAPGINWPEPAGRFVHVTEDGTLSPALLNNFLPERRLILYKFLSEPAPPVAVAAASATRQQVQRAREARAQVVQAATRLGALEALTTSEALTIRARAQEASRSGAFIMNRRTH